MKNGKNCRKQFCKNHYQKEPIVFNINRCTAENDCFRTALWTGEHLQITLMSIPCGCDIGKEMHNDVDQFIKIQRGTAKVVMGKCEDKLDFCKSADANSAVVIPAGYWHNIINTGSTPLKLYSIYAPPQHPYDTVHKTKKDAEEY